MTPTPKKGISLTLTNNTVAEAKSVVSLFLVSGPMIQILQFLSATEFKISESLTNQRALTHWREF